MKKDKLVTFRVSEQEREALNSEAKERKMKVSQMFYSKFKNIFKKWEQ